MGLEIWHRTINLNLLHPFLCCRHAIPHMITGGGGSIINFASMVGLTGSYRPTYAAAKGGIMSFTKTLAREMARNSITVNCVCPGPTETALLGQIAENNEKLYSLVLERTKEADLSRMLRVNNIRLIDAATRPGGPIRPQVPLNIGTGIFVGLLLGIDLISHGVAWLTYAWAPTARPA